MINKWILKINDKTKYYDNFYDAVDLIRNVLYEHFDKYKQCYYDRVPFSVGVLEGALYDDNSITDEQIVVFQRISMLLNRLLEINEFDFASKYIKRDYSLHFEDDYIYDLNIIKKEDEIILKTVVDLKDYIDILETNMFDLISSKEYYFISQQKINTYSPGDRFPLGFDIYLNMTLKKEE